MVTVIRVIIKLFVNTKKKIYKLDDGIIAKKSRRLCLLRFFFFEKKKTIVHFIIGIFLYKKIKSRGKIFF